MRIEVKPIVNTENLWRKNHERKSTDSIGKNQTYIAG
jgi:hypothetical protein